MTQETKGVRMLAKEGRAYAKRLNDLLSAAEEGELERIDIVITMASLIDLIDSILANGPERSGFDE